MTEGETRELMALLAAAYPNQTITPESVTVYCTMLSDLDAGEATAAVREILSTSKFFPTIAEIRQTVAERTSGLVNAGEAWGEVMSAVKAVGMYGKPSWSSPAVQAAVRAIGWENICQCERDDLNTLRAQFQRIYEAYRTRAVQNANLEGLGLAQPEERPRLPSGERSPWGDEAPTRLGQLVVLRREGAGGE